MKYKRARRFKPPTQVEFIKSEEEALVIIRKARRQVETYHKAFRKTAHFKTLCGWPKRVVEFRAHLTESARRVTDFCTMLHHVVREIKSLEAMEATHPFSAFDTKQEWPQA